VVHEGLPTRDHTEIMLRSMGAGLNGTDGRLELPPGANLSPLQLALPGDCSSAAFFVAAALCVPDSELEIRGSLVNPRRTGLMNLLSEMGADIELADQRQVGGEQVANIIARSSALAAAKVDSTRVPGMIDELPLLAVLATQAKGCTEVRGAAELRVKESDRIAAIAEGLRSLGAEIEELPDGFAVEGPQRLLGGRAGSCGDHRIAMALAVAALFCENESTLSGAEAVAVSYPGFWQDLDKVVQI
jgi:3-phosphoshikimate 1-carboxyvinyltransferase